MRVVLLLKTLQNPKSRYRLLLAATALATMATCPWTPNDTAGAISSLASLTVLALCLAEFRTSRPWRRRALVAAVAVVTVYLSLLVWLYRHLPHTLPGRPPDWASRLGPAVATCSVVICVLSLCGLLLLPANSLARR